ncbi:MULTISPECIES: hypothetical protein [unclassified Streptomyces]|uniref:hypothetical protein n=1 Tax=unclassified Streptomyces TaxID=2593676 RepID=UPI00342392AC
MPIAVDIDGGTQERPRQGGALSRRAPCAARCSMHWVSGGPGWRVCAELSADPVRRQFVEIGDECYARAVADGPPVAAADYLEFGQ